MGERHIRVMLLLPRDSTTGLSSEQVAELSSSRSTLKDEEEAGGGGGGKGGVAWERGRWDSDSANSPTPPSLARPSARPPPP